MAVETRPKIYQAVTKSYPYRPTMHGTTTGAKTTLCGWPVQRRSKKQLTDDFIAENENSMCGRCLQSIKVMDRAHPGFE